MNYWGITFLFGIVPLLGILLFLITYIVENPRKKSVKIHKVNNASNVVSIEISKGDIPELVGCLKHIKNRKVHDLVEVLIEAKNS